MDQERKLKVIMNKCHSQDMIDVTMSIDYFYRFQLALPNIFQEKIPLFGLLAAGIQDNTLSGIIRYNVGVFPEWIEFEPIYCYHKY